MNTQATPEPRLISCTQRISDTEIDIECRFADGQKFVAITIDADFPGLANDVVGLLNELIVLRGN